MKLKFNLKSKEASLEADVEGLVEKVCKEETTQQKDSISNQTGREA